MPQGFTGDGLGISWDKGLWFPGSRILDSRVFEISGFSGLVVMLASHQTPGPPCAENNVSLNLIVAGIVIAVFWRRDFINVGLVLKVKSALLGKGLEFRIQDLGVHGLEMRI